MTNKTLSLLIREYLLEQDDSSKKSVSGTNGKVQNFKQVALKQNNFPAIKPPIDPSAIEFTFNNWSDVCYRLYKKNHWYSLWEDLYDYLNRRTFTSISGPGYVLFGVERYSPIADILGTTAASLLSSQIAQYKAYGHAWTMFVNEDGSSERYEFAFGDKCDPVTRETIINNIDTLLKRDSKYAANLYDNLAVAIGTGFGAIVGSAASTLGTIIGGAAGATLGKITQLHVDDATKSYMLREIMPTLVEKFPEKVSNLIHFNIPGDVYNTAGQTRSSLLTTKKFINIAESCAEKNGIIVHSNQFDGKYYYMDFYNPKNEDTWRYKIKNTVLNAYGLADPSTTNQPANVGVPAAAIGNLPYNEDRRSECIGLLVFEADDIATGKALCESIKSNACNVPYTLPIPGSKLLTPEISNAYNCGLFAATAANKSMSNFQFDLSNKSDEFTSPVSFFYQGQSFAVDAFDGLASQFG